ncbi:MAG: hypothetical protein HY293_20945 [Planctomycetes bacterium]|nr:hypothetical protein [Planctomycetota bacterium]
MRRLLALLLLVGGLSRAGVAACDAPVQGAGKPAPGDRWKIDFKLSLAEKAGRWVFSIDGSSDLPASTLLRARITAVTVMDDPVRGTEEDEEPLVRRDDELQPEIHTFKVGSGWIHEDVCIFDRKPYSLRYRAEIQYLPHDQSDAITLRVGDFGFSRRADLRLGSEDSFEAELKERVPEFGRDLVGLDRLGSELRRWMGRMAGDSAGWTAWKQASAASLAAMWEGNRRRYDLWAVWVEYQARMRIRGLCGALERIIGETDLQEPDLPRLRKLMAGFVESLDDAFTVIGFEPPLDAREGGAAVDAYEAAVAPLREGAGRPEACRRARAQGLAALFDLLELLRTRRRAYVYVNSMGLRLGRLVELIDAKADPEELAEAFRAHEAALRDFRAFVGLK